MITSRRIPGPAGVLGCLALIAATCITAPASAQYGEAAGIAEAMRPEYLSRDVVLFVEGLGLDETQRAIMESIFDDYQGSFENGFEQMRQRYEELRPDLQAQDESRVMRLVFAPFVEWSGKKRELGEQFRNNVRAVLNAEQLEMWPAFMRRVTREKTLPNGRLSGESLNLFHIVRDLHLDKPIAERIQPIMDDYDFALDAALVRRNKTAREMQTEMLNVLQDRGAEMDPTLVDRQLRGSVAVREVNDRFIAEITAALPPEIGAEFERNALQRAYPQVYRRTGVHRMFQAAQELDDLDDETRQIIMDLEATYDAEMEGINIGLVQAIREHDVAKAQFRARAFAAKRRNERIERPTDPTRPDMIRRDQIGRHYTDALSRVLMPDQFASLPGANRWLKGQNRRDQKPTGSNKPGVKPGRNLSDEKGERGGTGAGVAPGLEPKDGKGRSGKDR